MAIWQILRSQLNRTEYIIWNRSHVIRNNPAAGNCRIAYQEERFAAYSAKTEMNSLAERFSVTG